MHPAVAKLSGLWIALLLTLCWFLWPKYMAASKRAYDGMLKQLSCRFSSLTSYNLMKTVSKTIAG